MRTFPEIQIGTPIRHGSLSAFPLFTNTDSSVDYVLSDESLKTGSVTVREISESGSVPNLSVENQGDRQVLFLEGEELVGAKQNRVLNTSVLIAAHTTTTIPVSCVEQGRWGYRSRHFGSGGTHSPSKLRYHLKASVSRSLQARGEHRADQGQVWREVSRQQAALGAHSGTSAMSDTFNAYRQKLDESRQQLEYVDGATGVAVAIGDRIAVCDLFDKPATCRKVWNRLLTGYVLDAQEDQAHDMPVDRAQVEEFLDKLRNLNWQSVDAVGEGEEARAESANGDHASVLSMNDVLVHGSFVAAIR
jgi:hypothetical protein